MYIIVTVLTALALRAAAQGGCDPATNCQLPNCRCFLDSAVPGGLNVSDVPQLVVLTMDYALNEEYEPLYNQIFSVANPNGCEVRGTFFVQDKTSNLGLVKRYAEGGFEIGISSLDGTVPATEGDMLNMMKSKNLFGIFFFYQNATVLIFVFYPICVWAKAFGWKMNYNKRK